MICQWSNLYIVEGNIRERQQKETICLNIHKQHKYRVHKKRQMNDIMFIFIILKHTEETHTISKSVYEFICFNAAKKKYNNFLWQGKIYIIKIKQWELITWIGNFSKICSRSFKINEEKQYYPKCISEVLIWCHYIL